MSSASFAEDLAAVQPRQFVTISGYPESEDSRWHVNKAVNIGVGSSGPRKAIILQAADASEHWISAVISETDGAWACEHVMSFEGEPPAGMETSEAGTELDAESLSVVEVTDEK